MALMRWRRFWWFLGQNSFLKMIRNGFQGKEVASPLHRRACARGCICIFCGECGNTKHVSWSPVQVQVCTLYRCFWHQFTCLQTHSSLGMHVHLCRRSLLTSARRQGWVGSASLQGTCCWPQWRGTLFWTWGTIKILSVFSLFWTGAGVHVGVCVCIAHTGICVQSTHVYICWNEKWDLGVSVFFLQLIFFLEKDKQMMWMEHRHWNPHGFELHRPSIKGYSTAVWSNNSNHYHK